MFKHKLRIKSNKKNVLPKPVVRKVKLNRPIYNVLYFVKLPVRKKIMHALSTSKHLLQLRSFVAQQKENSRF
jgi:hypothetical protein